MWTFKEVRPLLNRLLVVSDNVVVVNVLWLVVMTWLRWVVKVMWLVVMTRKLCWRGELRGRVVDDFAL